MRYQRTLFCLLVQFLLTAPAHANSGTPLMHAGLFHLLIGNLLIGWWEAYILAKRFGLPVPPTRLMVAANYTSAFAGLSLCFLGAWLSDIWKGSLLEVGLLLLILMVVLAFGLTSAVEWRFCRRIAGDRPDRDRLAWRMSLTAQTASYAILVPLYLLVAPINMLFHVRPLASVAKPPMATVYYLDRESGGVWRILTDGTGREQVIAQVNTDWSSQLLVTAAPKGTAGDLSLVKWRDLGQAPVTRVLIHSIAPAGTFGRFDHPLAETSRGMYRFTRYCEPRQEREWSVRSGSWFGVGIEAEQRGGPEYRLALETPYLVGSCRNVTVLPNDQAVFQMAGTIVLLDLPSRRLATLAAGRGPVVVLSRPMEEEK